MASVLLAFDDVGLGVQLQESLEGLGYSVTWDPKQASGPTGEFAGEPEAVLLVVAHGGGSDAAVKAARAWQQYDPVPGILLLGTDQAGKQLAEAAHLHFLSTTAGGPAYQQAIDNCIALRFAGQLNKVVLMRALGLPSTGDPNADAVLALRGARNASKELVRETLRTHANEYVAVTDMIPELRELRALIIPEVELAAKLNGTKTLQRALRLGPLDPWQAGKFIWAMVSIGAVTLTSEPPDLSSRKCRAVWITRRHLKARLKRLDGSTFYDVLEVTPTADQMAVRQAATTLALRYDPARIGSLDLADANELVATNWAQIRTARSTLLDWPARARYNDYLAREWKNINSEWAPNNLKVEPARKAFAVGQRALIDGEVHKAVSNFATAARMHPNHPEYECSLAYAQFRASVTKGADRSAEAARRRKEAEAAQIGRRPWPRALLALGMLCAADNDADAARWYLAEALECDPEMPAAKRLLSRLG